jgi:CspA family cold shock protein
MQPTEVEAVVRSWNDEEGWGVLDSQATEGGCWAHHSALDMNGHASATAGQRARLVYEQAEQDGFRWRAIRVTLDGVPPRHVPNVSVDNRSAAYRSHLTITQQPPSQETP